MAWDYLRDGQIVGRVKILERLTSSNNKDHVMYAVSCCGCGARYEMSHAYILKRDAAKRSNCLGCAQEPDAPKMAAAATDVRKVSLRERYPDPVGVRDALGRHWPSITGRMGRWNDSNQGPNREAVRGRKA